MNGDTATSSVPGGTPPIATPSFSGAPIPGAGAADPSQQVNEMTKRIMAAMAQAAQRKQFAGQAVPGQIPGGGGIPNPMQIGMDTANPHAWGGVRFMGQLGNTIRTAVAAKKKHDVLKAEGDWTYMQSALNEKYAAEASGDKNAIAAAEAKLQVITGDQKKLKKMSEALSQSWLDPTNTKTYAQALKSVNAKTSQSEAQKQQASQGIRGLFQRLLGQRQQPQLSPEQRQAMAREIEAKAPTVSGAGLKEQTEAAKAFLDIEKAATEARQKYAVATGLDGKLWAYNKSNPREAFQLRDAETGKEIVAQTKPGQAPKVLMNGGVPFAVQRGGKTLTPDTEGWTKEDQTLFDGAKDASRMKQQLRIPPEIGDQIGAPPDPSDYAKGQRDPKYATDLREYGKKAMALEMTKASASAVARAKAMNDYKIVEVTDYDEQGNPVTHYTTGKAALEGGLSSAVQGAKNLSRSKQMEDIESSSKKLRESVEGIDKPFTTKQIALMQEALKAGDEGVASAEFQALANEQLTDQQFQTVLWIKHLNERAMSLRNIAGMGQGAQDTRDAIRSLLPNMGTGDPKRMKTMLDAFDNQVSILKSGVPKAGGQVKAEQRKAAKSADEIEFTPAQH